jgi:hypothetical protein
MAFPDWVKLKIVSSTSWFSPTVRETGVRVVGWSLVFRFAFLKQSQLPAQEEILGDQGRTGGEQ